MAKSDKKSSRIRPRLPRGFADRDAADIRAVDAMMAKIKGVYERYGFDPVETPFFEYTEALGKFLPDSDRPNEGVFSLTDDDDQWLSLRYDLTAPLARYVAEHYNDLPKPYRSYRSGWVFRNEKPGPGRFRQFMQMDADTVGTSSVAADAEMAMMMADVMEAVGIKRGDYVIRVNNRKVLDGVMEAIGVTDEAQKLAVLRAIDKLDRLGVEGVRLLLGEGRWDGGREGEGDFTPGAGLDNPQMESLEKAFVTEPIHELSSGETRNPDDVLEDDRPLYSGDGSAFVFDQIETEFPDHEYLRTACAELRHISDLVRASDYGTQRIMIDPSVVRGLEYYTGPVFEADLTFETVNEKGKKVIFGSVGGGGRYDGLVGRFKGENVPATGFSIGVSRLASALKNLGKLGGEAADGPVVVTVMDKDRIADYQKFVATLRNADIRAELYLGNPKQFGKQLQYADRRNAPCVIIQGEDEAANGKVQIKDLIEGKKKAAAIADNQEWRDERPGQFEVDAADLVEKVRELLQRQKAG
ncbi:MAG: histidine--tRNA ligase [Alphaproteobacteria bacterium]